MTPPRSLRDGIALSILGGALAAAAFFAVTRDRLFFHSDAWSLILALAFLSILLALVPATLWLLAAALRPAWAARLEEGLAAVLAWGLLAAFPVAALGGAAIVARQGWALEIVRSFPALAAVAAGVLVLAAYPVFFATDRRRYRRRTRQLARIMAGALVLLLLGGAAANHLAGPGGERGEGRVRVLLVLDGLPARYTRHFGWDAPETALDRQFAEAAAYAPLRSSAVWTFAWFGALYGGSTQGAFDPLRRLAGDNLIARLQRQGSGVRWMAFHQNGIPEASAGHVQAYAGLRSSFLTPRYGWIPRLLGLDYHLVLPNPGIASLLVGSVAKAAFGLLNPGWDRAVPGFDPLLREADRMSREAGDHLLVFHTSWNVSATAAPVASGARPEALWALEDDRSFASGHYYSSASDPEAERAAQAALGPSFEALGRALEGLRAELRARGLEERVQILLTADHGSAYEAGRRNYGYHPIEAVVQVPLFVYGRRDGVADFIAAQAASARALDTIGLHRLLAAGAAALEPDDGGFTPSMTLRSDERAEWFMVLARGPRVLRANIHPASAGGIEAFERSAPGYDVEPAALPEAGADEALAAVARALAAFGIAAHEAHERYR